MPYTYTCILYGLQIYSYTFYTTYIISTSTYVLIPCTAGSCAPINVFLEAGLTGMEPAQTGFFQALGIATKITKGNIEVIKRFPLATAGQVHTSCSLARLPGRNIY